MAEHSEETESNFAHHFIAVFVGLFLIAIISLVAANVIGNAGEDHPQLRKALQEKSLTPVAQVATTPATAVASAPAEPAAQANAAATTPATAVASAPAEPAAQANAAATTPATAVAPAQAEPAAQANAAAATPATAVASAQGEQVVAQSCAVCHGPGVMGAPKIGDANDWGNRFKTQGGLDGLTKQAIAGIRQMPARGGNPALTDEEMHAAVKYMLSKAGISG